MINHDSVTNTSASVDAHLVYDDMESKAILKFFYPALATNIDGININNVGRAYALAMVIAAIQESGEAMIEGSSLSAGSVYQCCQAYCDRIPSEVHAEIANYVLAAENEAAMKRGKTTVRSMRNATHFKPNISATTWMPAELLAA